MGCAFSPLALNVYCDEVLDRRHGAAADVPVRVRYADNVCVPTRAVPEGEAALSKAADLLKAAGLRLKTDDATGLRDRRAGFLGFDLAVENGRLQLSVLAKAWEGLGELVAEARKA